MTLNVESLFNVRKLCMNMWLFSLVHYAFFLCFFVAVFLATCGTHLLMCVYEHLLVDPLALEFSGLNTRGR